MRRAILALVIFLLVAATPLVTAIPAFAGGEKGDWELGVYVGKAWLDDYGIFHPKDHALYGARLGYFLTDHWGLEASGQTLKTETQFTVLGVSNQDVKATALRLNLLYNFADGENKIRPFLTAGLGNEKFKVENYGESCDIGWNAGGGLRFFFSPHVNLRLDGRYVSTKVGDQVNERQHNTEATVGLGFLFRAATGAVELFDYLLNGSSRGASGWGGVCTLASNAFVAVWFVFGAWPFSRWAYPVSAADRESSTVEARPGQ